MRDRDYSEKIAELTCAIDQLRLSVQRLESALPRNDLGLPDADGHRAYHARQIKKSEEMHGYQMEITKKILAMAVTLFIGLFVVGFRQEMSQLLKG